MKPFYVLLIVPACVALLALPFVASAQDFVPLTRIPGIEEAARSQNLASFLDTLYKLCIGFAAVLAIIQILRGGVTYMLGDSVTEKREARQHIYMALFGLLLVLSPAIVFGIIDQRILSLNINVSGLAPGALSQTSLQSCLNVVDGTVLNPDSAYCCAQKGLHAWNTAGGNVVCRAEPPPEQPADDDYFILTPGRYYLIINEDAETKTDGSCVRVAVGSYETSEQCTAALSNLPTTFPGWLVGLECYLAPENNPRIPKSAGLCDNVGVIP